MYVVDEILDSDWWYFRAAVLFAIDKLELMIFAGKVHCTYQKIIHWFHS